MFFRNTNLPAHTKSLLTKRKVNNTTLVSVLMFVLFMCIGNNYTYAQTGDSAVIEYKTDTTHHFIVTKGGKVGVGTGTPQVQFHTTGAVRFEKFKNNTYEDSVLTTDTSGNLKFVARAASNWGGTYTDPGKVILKSSITDRKGTIEWGQPYLKISSSEESTDAASTLTMDARGSSMLESRIGLNSSGITTEAGRATMSATSTNGEDFSSKINFIQVTPDNIIFRNMLNNAEGDSVLTTDAYGNLKFKYITCCQNSQTQGDSSWAWSDTNTIYNRNKGNVGIGTQFPTAKFHTKGSIRFENFKNNIQGDSVLTTDENGNLRFVYMPYGSSGGGGGASYNFLNGVTQSNGNVSLGGQLQDSVKINLSGNQFSFNNGVDKVMHMSAEGNVGVGARADANYKLNVYGDVILGHDFDKIGAYDKLSFGGTSNTDPLYLQRYNLAYNVTDLRMNIGDDGGSTDRFVVGYIPYGTTNWVDAMVVEAGGNVGIGTDQVPGQLSVGRGHGIKLAVGNGQWAQSAIIRTSNDNTIGDYTDLLVPGSAVNSSVLRLTQAGNVGIGTLVPDAQYKLSVNGRIRAKGLRVQSAGWSDFVFEPDYKLLSLTELEKFIKANKHLPEIPSTKEVMKDGQEVGEIQSKLLQKIEELTLYTIELNKQVKALEDKNKKLEAQQQQIGTLQQQLDELKKLIINK